MLFSLEGNLYTKYYYDNSNINGGIIVGLGKTVSHLNWQTKEVTLLMELDKECETRMNDAKCDCSGRLWAGTVILLISLQY
jgi:sugar lactone lactonase YvrE